MTHPTKHQQCPECDGLNVHYSYCSLRMKAMPTSNLRTRIEEWAKTQWERIPPVPHAQAGSYERGYQNGIADVLRGLHETLERSPVETSAQ